MKKLTQDEFILKCKKYLGEEYSFDKTVYINDSTKVVITNKNGEDIEILPTNIKAYKGKYQKYDKNAFIKKAKQIYGEKYKYNKVNCTNSHDNVIITCPKHGDFIKKAYVFLNGQECPICGKRFNNEKFIEQARKIHGNKYDYSKVQYKNNHENIVIICPEHGEFLQTPASHLKGYGCSKCEKENFKKIKWENFLSKAKSVHSNKYDYSKSKYINADTKICIICPEHGEFWQTPTHHAEGQGCPICAKYNISKSLRLTQQDIIERAIKIHGNKYDYSNVKYENWDKRVEIKCPIHGAFLQTMHCHVGQGHGCPKCHDSHAEREIEQILKANKIKYETQKSFPWLKFKKPMFIDFYLTDFNIAIEFQGGQHFVPVKYSANDTISSEDSLKITQERDKEKLRLCTENNLKLYYIIPQKYKKKTCDFYKNCTSFKNINDLIKYITKKQ